ncbi:hypothetical protein C8J56DRAFT_139013 [Mycena floridula]|nr:hypothetical protein C8J56DRAFT_139013 [Mycena floridula]
MRSFLAVAGIGGPGSSAASSSSFTLVNRANTGEIKQIFNNLEGRDPNQQVIILNNYLGKDTRIMEGAEKMLSVPGIPEFLRQQVERELFNARSRIEAITTKRNEIQVSILKRGPALTTNPSLTHGNIAKTDKIFTYMQGMASSEQLKILDRHLTKHTRIMEGAEKMLSVPDIAVPPGIPQTASRKRAIPCKK